MSTDIKYLKVVTSYCTHLLYIAFHGILVHVFSMVHVYNEVANEDLQRRKSLKCLPADFPVFFWRSVDNIIMVLIKTQNILILKQSLLPGCSIRVIDCSIRVYRSFSQ